MSRLCSAFGKCTFKPHGDDREAFDEDEDEDAPPPHSFGKAAMATYKVVVQNPSSMMPVGKDLPRLMGKISVNNQRISSSSSSQCSTTTTTSGSGILRERIQEILSLLYNSLVPHPASNHLNLIQVMRDMFTNCSEGDLENHEFIQQAIIQIFSEEHCLFQTLRACNQSAIAQSVIFLKNMIQNKAHKEFKDMEWSIDVHTKSEAIGRDLEWTKQTVTICHNRGERVTQRGKDFQMLPWFMFRWAIVFTFQRRFNDFSADMAPLDFVSLQLQYKGAENYNSNLEVDKADQQRFGSIEKIDTYLGGLFEKFAREYRFVQDEEDDAYEL